MTTPETPDPLGRTADWVGRSTRQRSDYSHPEHGFYEHDRRICAQTNDDGWSCTRVREHNPDWPHISADYDRIRAVWGGWQPPPTVSIATAEYTLGMAVSDIADAHDPVRGVYVDPMNWCAAPITPQYICTRPKGHENDAHIGCTANQLVAFGPLGGADPFSKVTSGWYSDHGDWNNPVYGLYVERSTQCGATKAGSDYGCTRPRMHPGAHKSFRESGQFRWTDSELLSPHSIPTDDIQEPLDDTPVDTIDSPTTAPTVGTLMRLRDRSNLLYVMGARANGIEVLDMTHWRVREVPLPRMVPTGRVITEQEMGEVVRWYAGHRDQVKKVAVREYRGGRWCMGGLNDNLRSLGLEEHQPSLHGTVRVALPFECPDPKTQQTEIETALGKALADPAVRMALRNALPKVEKLNLTVDQLTVTATDFKRA